MATKRLLLLAIVLALLVALSTSASASTAKAVDSCVEVRYTQGVPEECFYPGLPASYVTVNSGIRLTGNIPNNNQWDGRELMLQGHLVESMNVCVMLFVDKFQVCP